jgi:hypothetical protein
VTNKIEINYKSFCSLGFKNPKPSNFGCRVLRFSLNCSFGGDFRKANGKKNKQN